MVEIPESAQAQFEEQEGPSAEHIAAVFQSYAERFSAADAAGLPAGRTISPCRKAPALLQSALSLPLVSRS